MPPKSRVGNRLSSWAFRTLYGPRLEDTQTGLRGIPWDLDEDRARAARVDHQ